MARIRSIKPEFFTHPEIVALSPMARLLFISLWTQADDEGRLRDQLLKIRANAFGEDDRVNVDALLDELSTQGRIVRYAVGAQKFIAIHKFRTHQRISKPTPSALPAPEAGTCRDDSATTPQPLPESSATTTGSLRVGSGAGSREQGEGAGSVRDRTERSRKKPETPWPEGWCLGDTERDVAQRHRVKQPEAEWAKFEARSRRDDARWRSWPQAWVTWCLKAVEFNGCAPDAGDAPAQPLASPTRIARFVADFGLTDAQAAYAATQPCEPDTAAHLARLRRPTAARPDDDPPGPRPTVHQLLGGIGHAAE